MVPCKSTAEEVSFEWSHHWISFTDLKVRTTGHVSIIDSGSEWVNLYLFEKTKTKIAIICYATVLAFRRPKIYI